MNRLWNLWCVLSGTEPDDSRQKLAFNSDRRVASLSAHSPEQIEAIATEVWGANPGISQHDFLDLWMGAAGEVQRRLDEVEEAKREAERRRVEATMEARRRERKRAERLRSADEAPWQRARDAVAGRRRAEELLRFWERSRVVRGQIGSLYNITSIANLARIASLGILCHDLAAEVRHDDMSDPNVQERRDGRMVDGRRLHQYANLYLNPRNAMLFRLHKREHRDVVVLEISPDVIDQPGVVVFDGNAAANASTWRRASDGLGYLDLARIRSTTWRPHGVVDEDLKRVMQAEVLVPGSVAPGFIRGFIAPSEAVLARAAGLVGHWPGRINKSLFFDEQRESAYHRD